MSSKVVSKPAALAGCLSVFASAFAFYLATVVIKRAGIAGLDIPAAMFVMARFVFGLASVLVVMAATRKRLRVRKPGLLAGRALFNLGAVYCFYRCIDLTSVAQANILNMTYPLFIALISWLFLKTQKDLVSMGIVLMAFTGVWLILNPGRMQFEFNSLWGLASGLSAAAAIIYLNLSRQYHDTLTTLFFLFSMGLVMVWLLFFRQITLPDQAQLFYLFWCSAFAIVGQYLLTLGFKYVSAIEGGIISSTRILLAAMLGPYVAMDPSLSAAGWVGALLIFSGNVLLTLRKARAGTVE